MRVLKMKINGLKLFPNTLDLEFVTQQRIRNEKDEVLYKIAPKIYQNCVYAFVGVNASGKTTTLKAISFVIQMLNNVSINNIDGVEILDGLTNSGIIIFETYFSVDDRDVYKLETHIAYKKDNQKGEHQFVITNEKLWCKPITTVKTRKNLFDFESLKPIQVREGNEEFLPDDISIVISLNKRTNSRLSYADLRQSTDLNRIRILGAFPSELIAFLDPSIEFLRCEVLDSDNHENGPKVDIQLKFKGKEEIEIHHPNQMGEYLSSGTIKGINVFVSAMIVLEEAGILIVDELENHFNKEIAATLIRFFMNHAVNRNGAVLIFSTHYVELLDEFDRNDVVYVVRNDCGITVENLSHILKRNDIKKSEVFESGYLDGTTPMYETYLKLRDKMTNSGLELKQRSE